MATTIPQLLAKLGACKRAQKKYANYRFSFKKAFIEAHWHDGFWIGQKLFDSYGKFVPAISSKYTRLPVWDTLDLGDIVAWFNVGYLFRLKKNRIKYWPEVKARLIEIGVMSKSKG